MKQYIISILIINLTIATLCAQNTKRANVWIFAGHAGLDFNSGGAVAINGGAMNAYEGCASISDENGNLLFYTNGRTVWDTSHNIMLNGNNLNANVSGRQNSVIIPNPCKSDLYYIFHMNGGITPIVAPIDTSLWYSIVDMNENNGLGRVISKNNRLFNGVYESIAAVHHANGIDVWVAAVNHFTGELYAYLVKSDTIEGPVISELLKDSTMTATAELYLKFSPDGKWVTTGTVRTTTPFGVYRPLCKFDNTTGIATTHAILPSNQSSGSFSPNSKLFYTKQYNGHIVQYDLSNDHPDSIFASADTIASGIFSSGVFQNAPDGKIYITTGNNKLTIINNPDLQGAACDIDFNGFNVDSGSTTWAKPVPTFIESYFDNSNAFDTTLSLEVDISVEDSVKTICLNDSFQFFSSFLKGQADSTYWEFGEGSHSNIFSPSFRYPDSAAAYTVRLKAYNNQYCLSDSTLLTIKINDFEISDTSSLYRFCHYDVPYTLTPNLDSQSFAIWNNIDTQLSHTVYESSFLNLEIIDSISCFKKYDSITVIKDSCYFQYFIPNAFTPDQDGFNDNFSIKVDGLFEDYTLEIFDRYGNRRFLSYSEAEYWDGLDGNGQVLPQGSYVYHFLVKNLITNQEVSQVGQVLLMN